MNQKNILPKNPYENETALKELLKMMKRKDKITLSYIVDKQGYASAKLDSKTLTEPFILQLNEELNNWIIDSYLLKGEITEPIPSANEELVNVGIGDNKFITSTLINYLKKRGFRFYMRITPEIVDKPNRLTVIFGFPYGAVVFKVKREKEILDELSSIDF